MVWFQITNDDISKTYGGGALRSYYSGAYSSSTNAYMLMYRQINETLNCDAMKIDEFPEYIMVISLFSSCISHLYRVSPGTTITLTSLFTAQVTWTE